MKTWRITKKNSLQVFSKSLHWIVDDETRPNLNWFPDFETSHILTLLIEMLNIRRDTWCQCDNAKSPQYHIINSRIRFDTEHYKVHHEEYDVSMYVWNSTEFSRRIIENPGEILMDAKSRTKIKFNWLDKAKSDFGYRVQMKKTESNVLRISLLNLCTGSQIDWMFWKTASMTLKTQNGLMLFRVLSGEMAWLLAMKSWHRLPRPSFTFKFSRQKVWLADRPSSLWRSKLACSVATRISLQLQNGPA